MDCLTRPRSPPVVQVSDLRTETAEGLSKLMYTGRISSAKMLSRLVLLWYNPVTEDDTRLRHCLGVFFQLYSRESRSVDGAAQVDLTGKSSGQWRVTARVCEFQSSSGGGGGELPAHHADADERPGHVSPRRGGRQQRGGAVCGADASERPDQTLHQHRGQEYARHTNRYATQGSHDVFGSLKNQHE